MSWAKGSNGAEEQQKRSRSCHSDVKLSPGESDKSALRKMMPAWMQINAWI